MIGSPSSEAQLPSDLAPPRTLTKSMVRALSDKAGQAGDLLTVVACEIALGTSREAIRAVPAWADIVEAAFDRWPSRGHAIGTVREMVEKEEA